MVLTAYILVLIKTRAPLIVPTSWEITGLDGFWSFNGRAMAGRRSTPLRRARRTRATSGIGIPAARARIVGSPETRSGKRGGACSGCRLCASLPGMEASADWKWPRGVEPARPDNAGAEDRFALLSGFCYGDFWITHGWQRILHIDLTVLTFKAKPGLLMLLSVLVPLFNEEEWVTEALSRVLNAPLPPHIDLEIIVVDDASTDDSASLVEEFCGLYPSKVRLIRHEKNTGKGGAIQTAIAQARGDFCLFQDADLEYSPNDYTRMLQPLLNGTADCVYGSRFMTVGERRVLYFWHSVANKLITGLCNMISGLNLTDMETCYKATRTSLLQSIPLRSKRFGIEPELTIKLAQRQVAIVETPISYYGRTYDEGKKIGLKDAFQAVGVMLRYGLVRDIYREKGPEILDVLANAPHFNRWMADTIRPYLGKRTMELGAGIGNLSLSWP